MVSLLKSLYDDHRSIAAVLHGMKYLVHEQRSTAGAIDLTVFRAMIYYLDVFSERQHHPKEDEFLFPAIRQKTDEANDVIQRLEQEHSMGEKAMRELEQSLVRYEAGGASEYESFAEAVDRYVDHYLGHMRAEEQELMPIARRVLDSEDWARIETAFAGHEDPLAPHAGESDMDKLFQRIVELAPSPIGMGPALR
jgi:hemerythrin-like domain-containing protein